MASFHAKEMRKDALTAAVSEEVSKYSMSLRNRLGNITEFQADFKKAFDGFVENSLPQDALYKQIEAQFGKAKKGKKDATSILPDTTKKPDEPILPAVDVDKRDLLAQKVAKHEAK